MKRHYFRLADVRHLNDYQSEIPSLCGKQRINYPSYHAAHLDPATQNYARHCMACQSKLLADAGKGFALVTEPGGKPLQAVSTGPEGGRGPEGEET